MTTETKQKWSIKAVLLFVLTTVAFLASFVALFIMAMMAGWSLWIAWGLPVMIDGAIVMTIIDMVETRRKGRKPGFSLLVFIACTLLSTFLNGYHAYISPGDLGLPAWIRVVIGITPPLLLLMLTKMFESAIEPKASPELLTEVVEAPVTDAVTATSQTTPVLTQLTDAPFHDMPTLMTAEPEDNESQAPAIAKPEPPVADVEHVAIEAPTPEPTVATPIATQEPVVATIDTGDDSADDQIVMANDEVDTDIGSDNSTDAKADSVSPLAIVTELTADELIPEEPDAQIEWIVTQARAGVDLSSWKTLAQLFSEGGRPMGDRTVQRRLAAARQRVPEAFAA